jgi:hypothetical protein
MLPDDILRKPWARPPVYTDRPADTEPEAPSEPVFAAKSEPPAPLRGGPVRDASKPVGGSRDTEPLVYRRGNPSAVFGLDDEDEL